MRWTVILTATLLAVGLSGCGGNDEETAPLAPANLLAQGWDYFENADYVSALNSFRNAFEDNATRVDAYNGAGWSAGKGGGTLTEAADYFRRSWQLDPSHYDALGGWIFVEYQQGGYQSAVNKALSLMNSKPGWRFLHQPSIDFIDIRLVLAASYFYLGEFEQSLQVVKDYLNPSFEADVQTREGQRELLEELERLRGIHG